MQPHPHPHHTPQHSKRPWIMCTICGRNMTLFLVFIYSRLPAQVSRGCFLLPSGTHVLTNKGPLPLWHLETVFQLPLCIEAPTSLCLVSFYSGFLNSHCEPGPRLDAGESGRIQGRGWAELRVRTTEKAGRALLLPTVGMFLASEASPQTIAFPDSGKLFWPRILVCGG